MSLRVVDPGLYSLIVDTGRPRYRSLGVPVGGAADGVSLALGNALVGNAPDSPALEMALAGPTLQATCELACVVYGAPFELASDAQRLRIGTTFTLAPGEELRMGGALAGMRAYLCIRGGMESAALLGSRSALEPIRTGQEIPCTPATIQPRWFRCPPVLETAPSEGTNALRVLAGAQAAWFAEDALVTRQFHVTPASNRMGLRIESEPLDMPDREIVSEPVCPGTVQVTREGQCIILGVDGQTIGGYPKIAQVISADLDKLGQLRPGAVLRFQRVALEDALELYRQRHRQLHACVVRLQAAEVFRWNTSRRQKPVPGS